MSEVSGQKRYTCIHHYTRFLYSRVSTCSDSCFFSSRMIQCEMWTTYSYVCGKSPTGEIPVNITLQRIEIKAGFCKWSFYILCMALGKESKNVYHSATKKAHSGGVKARVFFILHVSLRIQLMFCHSSVSTFLRWVHAIFFALLYKINCSRVTLQRTVDRVSVTKCDAIE